MLKYALEDGHMLEFPQIRVDCFTNPPPSTKEPWILPSTPSSSSSSGSNHQDSLPSCSYRQAPNAQLFLLSHAHSDHLFGLTDSFTGHIICTPDTKAMLLRLEAEMDRQHLVDGVRERGKRKYEGLKAKVVDRGTKTERVIDRIVRLSRERLSKRAPLLMKGVIAGGSNIRCPKGVRSRVRGWEGDQGVNSAPRRKPLSRISHVRLILASEGVKLITMDVRFLIKSADKAVLHTGDIRADRLFLQSLRRNPAVQEFIGPCSDGDRTQDGVLRGGRRILDRIYVDTGAV